MSILTPFISFEGIDGCGKSTQIELLKAWLKECDISAIYTREPGGCTTAEEIRQLVLSPKTDVGSEGELLLYLAARAEHVRQIIAPALKRGEWVISDRFADSTFAYQGYGRELNLEEMKMVNHVATKGVQPTITFLLDIDVTIGRERITTGRTELDRLEMSSQQFFERTRQGYLELAKHEPNRIVILDATASIESIHNQIREHLHVFLS